MPWEFTSTGPQSDPSSLPKSGGIRGTGAVTGSTAFCYLRHFIDCIFGICMVTGAESNDANPREQIYGLPSSGCAEEEASCDAAGPNQENTKWPARYRELPNLLARERAHFLRFPQVRVC